MNFFALSALINFVTTGTLCIIIFVKEKKTKLDITCFLFSLSIAIWSVGYFFWQRSNSAEHAYFWTRFLMGGAILIGVSYFRFILEFIGAYYKRKSLVVAVEYIFFALFLVNCFTPLIVRTVERRLTFDFWPVPGWAFHIFLIVWLISIFYSTYLLYETYKESSGLKKNQIRLLFYGVLIGFIAGSTNYLLWYNIPIPPYTNVLVSVYSIMIFYSVARYGFLNSKLISTELFVLFFLCVSLWNFFNPRISESLWIGIMFLVLIMLASLYLIKSVMKEVYLREEKEQIAHDLEETNQDLLALDQARADFISIASHQLRTPPATLKWYLSALRSGDYGNMEDSVKKAIAKAEVTNNSQISTIDDLLNASRIERGKLEFYFEETDLVELARITYEQLVPLAELKGVSLVFHDPGAALPTTMADKEKIRQVINNFIDNAIKYTTSGSVEISVVQEDNMLHLKVSDTGKGMSPEVVSNIFEKYTRGKDSIVHSTGLGLGLYVAKVIIAQHQGKIWAESDGDGKGSSFHFVLPIMHGAKTTSIFDLATQDKVVKTTLSQAAGKLFQD